MAYREAVSLSPNDSIPPSNLLSVKFELGQFSVAIGFINASLELIPEGADDANTNAGRTRCILSSSNAICTSLDTIMPGRFWIKSLIKT